MSLGLILISFIILVVVGVVFKRTAWPGIQRERMNRILEHSGSEADGIVLQVRQTGIYIDQIPQVAIQMQVMPLKGQNFVSELTDILPVTEMQSIKPGAKIKLKFNPRNHKQIIIIRDQKA